MKKILCFISEDFADFEITLLMHKLKNIGKYKIVTVSYTKDIILSESGLKYIPDKSIDEIHNVDGFEGFIIPGGPIKNQKNSLTNLIIKLNNKKIMIAAICNAPQYLGRSGILNNRKYTTSCSKEKIIELKIEDPFPRENYLEERVVIDENIITAKGRAFIDFSFAVFEYLNIYVHRESEKNMLLNDILNNK
ncbi:MAG: DJ-1/PfpI family protein [Clostridiales bacterium]